MSVIRIKNGQKSFQSSGYICFHSINLEINEKEKILIIGNSGAGKSTLLNIISLEDELSSGEYYFNNLLATKECKKNIIYVKQSGGLMKQWSILDNLLIPLYLEGLNKEDAQKKTYELLEKFNCVDLLKRKLSQLSEGEKQLIILLRSLLIDKEVYLFDESFSNLDINNKELFLKSIFDYLKEKIVIIVSHNLDEYQNHFDKIIHISNQKAETICCDDNKGLMIKEEKSTISSKTLTSICLKNIKAKGSYFVKMLIVFISLIASLLIPKIFETNSEYRAEDLFYYSNYHPEREILFSAEDKFLELKEKDKNNQNVVVNSFFEDVKEDCVFDIGMTTRHETINMIENIEYNSITIGRLPTHPTELIVSFNRNMSLGDSLSLLNSGIKIGEIWYTIVGLFNYYENSTENYYYTTDKMRNYRKAQLAFENLKVSTNYRLEYERSENPITIEGRINTLPEMKLFNRNIDSKDIEVKVLESDENIIRFTSSGLNEILENNIIQASFYNQPISKSYLNNGAFITKPSDNIKLTDDTKLFIIRNNVGVILSYAIILLFNLAIFNIYERRTANNYFNEIGVDKKTIRKIFNSSNLITYSISIVFTLIIALIVILIPILRFFFSETSIVGFIFMSLLLALIPIKKEGDQNEVA